MNYRPGIISQVFEKSVEIYFDDNPKPEIIKLNKNKVPVPDRFKRGKLKEETLPEFFLRDLDVVDYCPETGNLRLNLRATERLKRDYEKSIMSAIANSFRKCRRREI